MWNYLAFHDACDRVMMAGATAATRVAGQAAYLVAVPLLP